ncbi:hypothetical protein [uncultured Psychroserpens sp.]|uniref:hypothetical protein n=1 Tax=uncultured Psychroserpens sp. TaxID=255436 RepID=UPI002607B8E6|nr:hypothetical protein [uncultured Psychroserpens sp.]
MKDSNGLFIGKVVALIVVILSIFYAIYEVDDLRENRAISVAKVYDISFTRYSSKYAHYEYYYNTERYTGVKALKIGRNKKVLNKFFEVKFSSENPKNSEIDLTIEVKDTLRIRRAHFILN